MKDPLISVVTPCLNRAAFIAAAVESVLTQEYPNFEHIVMDGGSMDGTLGVLSHYPHLRVVSEPDHGMYHALNKAINLARGEIIGLLNTDDLFAQGCFQAVTEAFAEHPEALAVVGGISVFVENNLNRRTIETVPSIGREELWTRLIQGHPVTNAWFIKREVFERFGGFDDRMRWSADRFFLIHIALDGGIRPEPIDAVLYHYRSHAGSATMTTLDSRDPRYGFLRIKILQEDVHALDKLLKRQTLPPEVRKLMRQEHGGRCYRLAGTAAYHRKTRIALGAVCRGFRHDLFWPLIFIRMAARRIQKELTGRDE